MSGHEKRHLARGVELEVIRYIGFRREPVQIRDKVFATDVKPQGDYPLLSRPWVDGMRHK